ncbi:MAG: murein L,D-transpeptidase catalytic domain family protein [Bacteroidota bacterium]|nr:murein L,D-transpeptidase catalytic domain family protein [Bacteroidota bacterium]
MTKLKRKYTVWRKCLLLVLTGLVIPALFSFAPVIKKSDNPAPNILSVVKPSLLGLYSILSLDSLGLSKEAFNEAVTGYLNLQKAGTILKTGVLSIVDFSIPSFKKRLFVLDMENGKLLFNTLVAHGRNSGQVLATKFSNRARSFQSSLGFYLTGETYNGHKGYALRLMGMEQGINDNAYNRGIVVHAAPYVNEEISRIYGRLGRSEGCPAIPVNIHRSVIETIKDGSCFFIYGKDSRYANQSKLLKESRLS